MRQTLIHTAKKKFFLRGGKILAIKKYIPREMCTGFVCVYKAQTLFTGENFERFLRLENRQKKICVKMQVNACKHIKHSQPSALQSTCEHED
jgi:hypothetical protein